MKILEVCHFHMIYMKMAAVGYWATQSINTESIFRLYSKKLAHTTVGTVSVSITFIYKVKY